MTLSNQEAKYFKTLMKIKMKLIEHILLYISSFSETLRNISLLDTFLNSMKSLFAIPDMCSEAKAAQMQTATRDRTRKDESIQFHPSS